MPAHPVYCGSCLGVMLQSEHTALTDPQTNTLDMSYFLNTAEHPTSCSLRDRPETTHIGEQHNSKHQHTGTTCQVTDSLRIVPFQITVYAYHCIWKTMSQHHTVNILCGRHCDTERSRSLEKQIITTTRMSQTHNHGKLGFKIVTSVNRSANSNCEEFYLVPHNQTRDMCSDMSVNFSPKQLRGLSHEKKAKRTLGCNAPLGATHHSAARNMSMTACARTDKFGTVTPCRP